MDHAADYEAFYISEEFCASAIARCIIVQPEDQPNVHPNHVSYFNSPQVHEERVPTENSTLRDANESAGSALHGVRSEVIEDKPPKRKRRKLAQPELWRRKEIKNKRCCGEAYLGFRRKDKLSTKVVLNDVWKPARQMGPPCQRLTCMKIKTRLCGQVTEDDRKILFEKFWAMTWKEKKCFITSLIDKIPTKTKSRKKSPEESRRSSSLKYYLKVGGQRLQVCKELFHSTFGIKWSTVRHWILPNSSDSDPVVSDSFEIEVHEMKEPTVNSTLGDANALVGTTTLHGVSAEVLEDKPPKRKRRKVAQPELWRREQNKNKRCSGEAYLGFRRKDKLSTKVILNDVWKPARKMGPPCQRLTCMKVKTRMCRQVTEDDRKILFEKFWSMTWEEKKIFISSLIDIIPTKTKTAKKNPGDSRRSNSLKYNLKIGGEQLPVCKELFHNTFGIKWSMVRKWVLPNSSTSGNSSDAATLNNSAVKQPGNVDNGKLRQSHLVNFISLIPKRPSHCCHKNSSKMILSSDITSLNQLFILYKEKCAEIGIKPYSNCSFLKKIKKLNVSLHKPKKDRCDHCCQIRAFAKYMSMNSTWLEKNMLERKKQLTRKGRILEKTTTNAEV